MVKTKTAQIILVCLVFIDILCSFIMWRYYGMVENNPIMLWALLNGYMYWLFSSIKLILVVVLAWAYPRLRLARIFTWVIIIVYGLVWLQYFIGELI